MGIVYWARLAGFSVTLAILSWLVRVQLQDAEWAVVLRDVMTSTNGDLQGKPSRRGVWNSYIARQQAHLKILGRPYGERQIVTRIAIIFIVVMVATSFMRYGYLVSLTVSLVITFGGFHMYYSSKAKKRIESITFSFLNEAVPIALHAFQATNRLDRGVARMGELVHNKPLQIHLKRLEAMCDMPQFATPEDAFVQWANDLAIPEIKAFATATKQAKQEGGNNIPLSELWPYMAELLGEDLEFVQQQRSETSYHRKGGWIFYGMLAGSLILAYPFAKKYISPSTQVLFWIVIGIMSLSLYIIHRESQSVDV